QQRHPVHPHLRERYVHLRHHFISNTFLTNVSDNAHNRAAESFRWFTTEPDSLSERIAIRKESLCKRLVDDCDFLPVCAIARVVSSTAQQRYLHRLKIVRRNTADTDWRIFLFVELRMAFDFGKRNDPKAVQRRMVNHSRRLNFRQ